MFGFGDLVDCVISRSNLKNLNEQKPLIYNVNLNVMEQPEHNDMSRGKERVNKTGRGASNGQKHE